MKGRDWLIVGGIAVAGVIAYLYFNKGTSAGGLLGTGGQVTTPTQGPTSQQAPTAWNPSAIFTSKPNLSTGSANGAFFLQQTYSPYYSTNNDYSTRVQNDVKTQNTTDVKLF